MPRLLSPGDRNKLFNIKKLYIRMLCYLHLLLHKYFYFISLSRQWWEGFKRTIFIVNLNYQYTIWWTVARPAVIYELDDAHRGHLWCRVYAPGLIAFINFACMWTNIILCKYSFIINKLYAVSWYCIEAYWNYATLSCDIKPLFTSSDSSL